MSNYSMATFPVAFLCLGLLFAWLAPTRGSYDLDQLPNLYVALTVGCTVFFLGISKAQVMPREKSSRAIIFIWCWLLLCCVLTVLRRKVTYVELLIGPALGLGVALLVVLLVDDLVLGREAGVVVQADQMLIGTVVLGGLLTVWTVFVQARVLPNLLGWVMMPPPDMAPVTNFAQPNLGSLLMSMGVVCVMGWRSSGWYSRAVLLVMSLQTILVILLVTAILLTQSRAGLLLSMIGLATMLWLSGHSASRLLRLVVVVGVCAGVLILCQWLAAAIVSRPAAVLTLTHATLQRFSEGEGLAMRLQIMAHGLQQWMDFPLLGGGWGTHAGWVFLHAENISWPRYTNHAHNLVSQLLGETGLLGVVPIAIAFLVVLKRIFLMKVWRQSWVLKIYSVLLLVLLLHSLVEYPLWNLFFLVPFSWLLTRLTQSACVVEPVVMVDMTPARSPRFMRAGPGLAVVAIASALMVFTLGVVDERLIAQALYTANRHLPSPDSLGKTYFSDLIRYADPLSDSRIAADRRTLGERLVLVAPIEWLIERLAIDQALTGDPAASATTLVRLCAMYRHRCPEVLARLEALSRQAPLFVPIRAEVLSRTGARPREDYDLPLLR